MKSIEDIKNKEFKKAILGYDKDEVNKFLEHLSLDYENMNRENKELKSKISQFVEQSNKYNELENSLRESIKIGQSISEEVIKTANDKSQNIIDQAEVKKKEIIYEAIEESNRIKQEYEDILKSALIFKTRYRSFVESQLLILEDFYEDVNIDKSYSEVYQDDKSNEMQEEQ